MQVFWGREEAAMEPHKERGAMRFFFFRFFLSLDGMVFPEYTQLSSLGWWEGTQSGPGDGGVFVLGEGHKTVVMGV